MQANNGMQVGDKVTIGARYVGGKIGQERFAIDNMTGAKGVIVSFDREGFADVQSPDGLEEANVTPSRLVKGW